MNLDYFLNIVIQILNFNDNEASEDELHNLIDELFDYYKQVDYNVFFDELFNYIDKDFELYTLILSTLYNLFNHDMIIYDIEKRLTSESIDLFAADSILNQLRYIKFTNIALKDSYKTNRIINQKLLNEFKQKYLPNYPYTPYDEREKKRIVIATDQLLSINHAPTRIVLNICNYLAHDHGYEIYLLINLTSRDANRISQFWYNPNMFNFLKDLDGMFSVQYKETIIRGFQFEWAPDKISDISAACELINIWKPLCVFYIGGASYRHDIYKYYTTLISMPCTDGYIVSEAQVLVSSLQSDSSYIKESIQYIKNTNQHIENIGVLCTLREDSGHIYKKVDYNIPDTGFLLCIMGNRLDAEMSDDFISMMQELMYENANIYVAFIGDCTRTFFAEDLQSRVRFLGYQSELVEIMKMMDLFVNPPRKGGGSGATFALQAGVPIATLANNDVANFINNRLCCNNLDELKALIERYMNDKEFYDNEVVMCNEWKERTAKNNDSATYRDLISRVNDMLANKIIY